MSLCACEGFLDEEMVATLTQERYNTPEGVEELVNGAYEGLRFHHNYEWAYAMTNYGTDEFTNGGGADYAKWNTYISTLDASESSCLLPYWTNMYAQINLCNKGVQLIPGVLADDPDLQATRLGEVLFLRGFDYLKLVEQFSGVPISLEPIESDVTEFPRSSAGAVLAVIISDLRRAESLLPETPAEVGRITRSAAQHFLAKAYLFRASERNAAYTVSTDLDSAAYFADQVIFNSYHVLADDFNDLFEYTEVNGPNETNAEVILSSQFDNNQALIGRFGNQTHLYYLSIYRSYPGMTRDLLNGREFQRLKPTDYTLDVYDRKNDSRFYKSFKTAYLANYASTLPVWSAEYAPSAELAGTYKFNVGDTSIIYIVNSEDDTRFTEVYQQSFAPLMLVRYGWDEDGSEVTDYNLATFPSLSKYIDPFRTNYNDARGTRDGLLARLAETYLIAAEAYGRNKQYAKALTYINALRARAAYKEGESRSNVYYLAEQVPMGETGSTEASMLVTEEVFTPGSGAAAAELYPEGVTSMEDMFIHFVLNERSRELLGEFYRWVDLSRTETLIIRDHAFNPEAATNVAEKHLLRPLPQSFLDGVTSNGNKLTASEKEEWQNPGW